MKLKVLLVFFSVTFLPLQGHSLPTEQVPSLHQSTPSHLEDLETVRNRIIADLLAPDIDEKEIQRLTQRMLPDGSWPDIDYDDVSRTGFEHSKHLSHMLELGRAYKKYGTQFFGSPEVKKAASSALDFWIRHDFICENWWWNEMGTPGNMINLLLVMDDALTEDQKKKGLRIAGRANLEGVGARPGGDLIQIAAMMGKQALFQRDEAFLEQVLGIMADEIKVTTGRGLKPDMSFHHRTDNVISTLSYGSGYIGSFVYWIAKIQGTKYFLPEKSLELLVDYFLDGISQSMVYGIYPDPGARNREMTRQGALHPSGTDLAEKLLQISSYRKGELENIIKIKKGEIAPNIAKNRFFWHSEYFTHQRPTYFASVRMHSSRNRTMEEPHNEEGLKMHHFGDGSNLLSLTGREFVDIYPVWDWQKIPGTTTVQKPQLPHWKEIAKKGLTDFVGGISDGTYGAAAFDFQSPHDPLEARKSWFFFDDEYVCLGTAIHSTAPYPVATTINQTLLDGDVVAKQGGVEISLPEGEHTLERVSWILHNQVAYLFPMATALQLRNTTATGNWRQINHQAWATTEEVQKEVFSVGIDHGIQPEAAQYAYIVLPNVDALKANAYQKNPAVTVLANSPQIQAVQHLETNRSQIVFYQAGEIQLNKNLSLKVDQACMVMITADENEIYQLVVSDPSHKRNKLTLEVSTKLKGKEDQWSAAWNKEKKSSLIQVHLPQEGYAGQSVVLWDKQRRQDKQKSGA